MSGCNANILFIFYFFLIIYIPPKQSLMSVTFGVIISRLKGSLSIKSMISFTVHSALSSSLAKAFKRIQVR